MKKPSTPTASSASTTAICRAPRKPARPRPAVALLRRRVDNASSSSTSSSSSSTSIEAPRGCLRYILPRSKTLTPKSAKPVRLSIPDGDRRSAAAEAKAKASVERSGEDPSSDDAGTKRVTDGDVEGVLNTPVIKDLEVDNEKENGKERTPPVQASVSPEIQCGSASAALGYLSGGGAVTPNGRPCYGAGHVLSGVVDKRKCRPRGILTVRNVASNSVSRVRSKMFGSTDCSDDGAGDSNQSVDSPVFSAVPLPCEASMQWWLSPLNEQETEERMRCSSESGSEGSISPRSSDLSKCSEPMSISPSSSGRDSLCRNPGLASPSDLAGIKQLLEPESVDDRGSLSPMGMTPIVRMVTSKEDEIPFTMDCLSDGNVILTPHSHSSSGTQLRRSWCEDRDGGNDAEVDLLAEVLQKAMLSPRCSCSPWDLTTDLGVGGCIDLGKVQDIIDSKISWASASTLENSSQSQLRISWRDGLCSRMFEMDEYDCCRFLSDDEEDTWVELKPDQIHLPHATAEENLVAPKGESKLLHDRQETEHNVQKGEENSCLGKHCMAESMSLSGEGLTTSSDSDWNLSYKNQLFRL